MKAEKEENVVHFGTDSLTEKEVAKKIEGKIGWPVEATIFFLCPPQHHT